MYKAIRHDIEGTMKAGSMLDIGNSSIFVSATTGKAVIHTNINDTVVVMEFTNHFAAVDMFIDLTCSKQTALSLVK